MRNIPIILEFTNIFPKEIHGLLPTRNIDFTIELIPSAIPLSRTPYHMGVPDLIELII